jgi:hypothetical protein
MKKLTTILALLISTSAIAQEAPKAEAPKAPRTEFYLKFSADELQTLNSALMELPKRAADPFLAKLNAQLQQQTQQDANEAAAKQAGVK